MGQILIHIGRTSGFIISEHSAIDERLKAVSERTDIQFTNHTLRCTFGRTCWLVGIPLETIRDLL